MKVNKHYIAILSEGFPYKISASNNKNLLIARSILDMNFDVHVYSKLFYNDIKDKKLTPHGNYQGVKFRFLNKSTSNSIISVVFAFIKEGYYLFKESKGYKNKIFIISYSNIFIFIYYYLLSKIVGLKLIISIAEWHIAVGINQKGFNKINAQLFDQYAMRFVKGVIPISRFIEEKAKRVKKKGNIFLLPILTDFEYIDSISSTSWDYSYFLYCGSIGYIELIEFILISYGDLIKNIETNPIKLRLVIYGPKTKIAELEQKISQNHILMGNVFIESDLSYQRLIQTYKGAKALLIPLRNTIQDKARFPHKIAEYLASGRPIITNNWGEVGYYFSDKENAFVANNYDTNEFTKIMKEILENEEFTDLVGQNGKNLCRERFDYKVYSKGLSDFLLQY